jgi:hypothetical protein
MPATGVVHVEDALVWREGETIGDNKILHQYVDRPQIRGDMIDATKIELRLDASQPWIGKIDAPSGFHHNIVRPVQAATVIVIRHHGDTAIWLLAGHTPCEVFAGDEPALEVAGEPIGLVGGLLDQSDTHARRPLQPPIIANVTEQEIAAFLPSHWAFGRSTRATKAAGEFFGLLTHIDETLEPWTVLFNRHMSLLSSWNRGTRRHSDEHT